MWLYLRAAAEVVTELDFVVDWCRGRVRRSGGRKRYKAQFGEVAAHLWIADMCRVAYWSTANSICGLGPCTSPSRTKREESLTKRKL